MNLSDLRESRFLKQSDVEPPKRVTIAGLSQQNVAKEGAEPDMKIVVHFHELEKPLVLNSTNAQRIAQITGRDDDIENSWVGATVVLYNDPNVSFAGKLTGGIRVGAPQQRPAGAPAPRPQQAQPQQRQPQQEQFSDGAPVPNDDGMPF